MPVFVKDPSSLLLHCLRCPTAKHGWFQGILFVVRAEEWAKTGEAEIYDKLWMTKICKFWLNLNFVYFVSFRCFGSSHTIVYFDILIHICKVNTTNWFDFGNAYFKICLMEPKFKNSAGLILAKNYYLRNGERSNKTDTNLGS